jgi:hypothetical protein
MDLNALVGRWVRLPVTFWDQMEPGYSKKNHPSDWKTHYDVCRITRYYPKKQGYHESVEFEFTDGDKYSLTRREAADLHKKGLFQGKPNGHALVLPKQSRA